MRDKAEPRFDRIDKRILALLQEDASLSIQEIATKVNLSPTPCWRRIQQLRSRGVIRRQVAILDAAAVNVPITVFVMIKTNQHNAAWLERFARGVAELAEVVEFYRMSGDVDYLLRVVVPDIAGYELHIHETGCVPTRPGNLHDLFNALAWLSFPRLKATLNALHAAEIPHEGGRRGRFRDLLTLLDEGGALVACADPGLVALVREHRWQELFWDRRERVLRDMRIVEGVA